MNVIRIISPGLFTTVQDLGRQGFGPMGVSASGAADSISLRLGNRLVDNAEGSAALEMTLVGGSFLFPQGAAVALTGSDFGATLDDVPVRSWTSVGIRPGQTLRAGATRSGARCYLCIRGGIAVKPFLGSASTHVLTGLGGYEGRPLKTGDELHIGEAAAVPGPGKTIAERAVNRLSSRSVLRVTKGPQSDWFSESARRIFYDGVYRVAEESNRMGLRLEGTTLPAPSSGHMITEGVSLGAIQVPHGGKPIIVFVEQQTTGGYPKIANVISADLHRVGQLRPRDEIRFEEVDFETARAVLREQEEFLASEEMVRQ